jgi:prepilin-type N-terminal cleavage/methylation domain-containing protein
MGRKGFTLIEILAVVVVLAILLAIAIPLIVGIFERAARDAFLSDARLVLKAIHNERAKKETFDVGTINKDTISSILQLSNENYQSVRAFNLSGKTYIEIYGQNKWQGLTACGTYPEMIIGNHEQCHLLAKVTLIERFQLVGAGSNGIYGLKNNNIYFSGVNPNNWLEFGQVSSSNSTPILWRVIRHDSFGIRLIYEGVKQGNQMPTQNGRITVDGSTNMPWDNGNSNQWEKPVTLKPIIATWYNNFYVVNKNNFVESIRWCIGAIANEEPSMIYDFIDNECKTVGSFQGLTNSNSAIGLINPSDYISTSTNSICNSSNNTNCSNNNYLYKADYNWWTLSARDGTTSYLWYVSSNGALYIQSANIGVVSVRPVINIKLNVLYDGGEGTLSNPYRIKL